MDNYESWLKPLVAWLEERQVAGQTFVNDTLLKTYLELKYGHKSYDSYWRVGKQCADFINRY